MYCANKNLHVIGGNATKRSFIAVLVVVMVFFHVPNFDVRATPVVIPIAKFSTDIVLLGVGILIAIDAHCRGETHKNVCFRQKGTSYLGEFQRQMGMSLSERAKFRTKMYGECMKIFSSPSCVFFLRSPISDKDGMTIFRTKEESLSAEDRTRIQSAAANHARLQQTKAQYKMYLEQKIIEIKKCLQNQRNISEKQTETVEKALERYLRQWHLESSRLYYSADVVKFFVTLYERLRIFEKFCRAKVKNVAGENNIVSIKKHRK